MTEMKSVYCTVRTGPTNKIFCYSSLKVYVFITINLNIYYLFIYLSIYYNITKQYLFFICLSIYYNIPKYLLFIYLSIYILQYT